MQEVSWERVTPGIRPQGVTPGQYVGVRRLAGRYRTGVAAAGTVLKVFNYGCPGLGLKINGAPIS